MAIAAVVAVRELVVVNTSGSVPVGLYVAATPATATFVTFCLPRLPRTVRHDPAFCAPDQPKGRPVIKRLHDVTAEGVVVRGDRPDALDSRLFGPLDPALVRGWWRPVLTCGR